MALPQHCDECGFDYPQLSPGDAVVALRSFPRRYRVAFAGFDEDDDVDALVHRRPAPGVWSAIEYAAHVRGVFEMMRARIERAGIADGAAVASVPLEHDPWHGHARSDALEVVLEGLGAAALALADVVGHVPATDWGRTVVRDDGAVLDALWMARQSVHEGSHHLRDVHRVIDAVRGQHGT